MSELSFRALARTRPLVVLLLAISACGASDRPAPASGVAAAPPPPAAPLGLHAADLSAMDRSVSPGTDFFLYANGAWLAKAEIPADRTGTGVALRLIETVEQRTKAIVEDAAAHAPAGSALAKVGTYYATFMDEAAIEARGTDSLKPALGEVARINDTRALSALLGRQLRADVDPLNLSSFHTARVLGLWVEQDLNDPSRCAPYLMQGGLGLPERSYYLDDSPHMTAVRAKYVAHLAAVMRLAGIADADAKAARVVAFEKKIALSHAPREESEDVNKANNVWTRGDFATRAPGMDWEAFFGAASLGGQASFIVWHPRAVAGLGALVTSEPLATWKEYLAVRAIERAAKFLPHGFTDERFAFYAKELRGLAHDAPRWRRALDALDDALGEAVGKAYVERFFPPESKKGVADIVANEVAAFRRRIEGLTWMAPSTKAKAIEKLTRLRVGVGYPDAWRDYDGLKVVAGDALGNAERAELFEYQRNLAKLGHPPDRDAWEMLPHTVDAVNLPVRNALNFPAAILVAPFFDPQATSAANYGAVGSVIGHEISHSFDDQGAKFDAQGRFVNWWTPEDLARFQASGAKLAAQFSTYKPFPDVAVNGKQTLGENIADLAGLGAAYDAWRTSLGGKEAPMVSGLTGDQQFFLGFAQAWMSKERDEEVRFQLVADGHAPPHYRTLTVRNLDPWYAAFGVKEGDALFLKPTDRVTVW
jgi:putative endopeptidase